MDEEQIHSVADLVTPACGQHLVHGDVRHVQAPSEIGVGDGREEIPGTRFDPLELRGAELPLAHKDFHQTLMATLAVDGKPCRFQGDDVAPGDCDDVFAGGMEHVLAVGEAEAVPLEHGAAREHALRRPLRHQRPQHRLLEIIKRHCRVLPGSSQPAAMHPCRRSFAGDRPPPGVRRWFSEVPCSTGTARRTG